MGFHKYFFNNLNQELEYYIFYLRQTTTLITEIEYLDYKLDIWKNIEEKKENDLLLF